MNRKISPLDWQTPICDPVTGVPSPQFIRLWQQMFLNGDDAAEKDVSIVAGTGLSGGGDLSEDRTIDLENTAVTPGSYTSTNLTVDAQGRITAASSGGAGVLGYAFQHNSVTQASNITALGGLIDSMTVAFTMPADGVIQLDHSIIFSRASGSVRILPLLDGALLPRGSANANYYGIAQGENAMFHVTFMQLYDMTAGSHTITLNYSDALSVNTTTFLDRSMIIRQVA